MYHYHPVRPEKFHYSTASIGPGVLKLCMGAGIDYYVFIAKHLLNEQGELRTRDMNYRGINYVDFVSFKNRPFKLWQTSVVNLVGIAEAAIRLITLDYVTTNFEIILTTYYAKMNEGLERDNSK